MPIFEVGPLSPGKEVRVPDNLQKSYSVISSNVRSFQGSWRSHRVPKAARPESLLRWNSSRC